MEGVFIPSEFYKDKNLKGMERDVLALYKYYTENGKNKCCSLNNTQIADILNVSTRFLRMVKKHLKELGYIRTDGGIKVTYIGQVGSTVPQVGSTVPQVGSTVPQVGSTVPTDRKYSSYQVGSTVPQVGSTVPTDRKYSSYQVGSTVPIKQEAQFPHKKEKEDKEEKKEIKKEMSEKKTNLDLLLDRLPDDYKTPETIDFIKNNYLDRINKMDFSEGGVIDSCVVSLKSELLKKFTIYPVINKPVLPKRKTEDDFMF